MNSIWNATCACMVESGVWFAVGCSAMRRSCDHVVRGVMALSKGGFGQVVPSSWLNIRWGGGLLDSATIIAHLGKQKEAG